MKWDDAAKLLTYAASCDPRIGTPGKQDAIRWADLLDGLDPQRCMEAIRRHYRESPERVMPGHIRALARTTTDGDAGVSQVPTPAGEVLCGACGAVHRPGEACGALVARPFPRPLASVAREVTAAPVTAAESARERALQRARGERGISGDGAPWAVEPPPDEPHAARPVEERDYAYAAGAVTVQDAPPPGLPASSCYACPAGGSGDRVAFLDYPAGRSAHRSMFGHDPQSRRG